MNKKIIDWNHIYLLGWYDYDNISYLTTWSGELPYIYVIITGPVLPYGPPIWNTIKNWRDGNHYTDFQIYEVEPKDWNNKKAEQMHGIRAFGWYIEKGFERKEPETWKAKNELPNKAGG